MPTMPPLDARLAALAAASLDELRAEWRRLYRTQPPPRLSRDLLTRGVAARLQEDALGGLSAITRRRLLAAAGSTDEGGGAASRPPPRRRLRPGTRLLRTWHGRTHVVTVLDAGFDFEDRRYASLTEIARAITGAHWSGPRFFGLTRAVQAGAAGDGA